LQPTIDSVTYLRRLHHCARIRAIGVNFVKSFPQLLRAAEPIRESASRPPWASDHGQQKSSPPLSPRQRRKDATNGDQARKG